MYRIPIILLFLLPFCPWAQVSLHKFEPTREDSIRGMYGEYRSWWDLRHYDLCVEPEYDSRSLSGKNTIRFIVRDASKNMLQLDLQQPMTLDSVIFSGQNFPVRRYGASAYLISFTEPFTEGEEVEVTAYFHGKPKQAVNPPWDGGFIWTSDEKGNPWISVACQGLGASVWWPCKDHGADEPDEGVSVTVKTHPDLVAVSNGRLVSSTVEKDYSLWKWKVVSPINNYNVSVSIGKYARFQDVYMGEEGMLDVGFWVLSHHEKVAKKHLRKQTLEMLKIFEYWFGVYPFYADGYQLVEVPFLGMEHQSAIAYGNGFANGYRETDLSGSGWGLKWDYILVHETGHEWFGNSITAKDASDMWIQEAFTTYSEVLYVESRFGKKAADAYALGLRKNIRNDRPLEGIFGVNHEGSGDMYFKGVQLIHTYRQILNDDVKFREILREMNRQFFHKTVSSKEIIALMQEYVAIDLAPFFETYLRMVSVPKLRHGYKPLDKVSGEVFFWFENVAPGFSIPVDITIGKKTFRYTVGDKEKDALGVKILSKDIRVSFNANNYISF